MADLQVRREVLDGLGSWLSSVSERLSGACTALRSLDIAALGELGRVDAGFTQCDTAIAAACRPAGDER